MHLKIPPLLLVGLFALVMFLVAQYFDNSGHILTAPFVIKPLSVVLTLMTKIIVSITVMVLGLVVCGAGVFYFRQMDTTVNPTKPETSSALVTSGVYRYTRNPMYLGFLFLLIGWGILLTNVVILIVAPILFVIYLNVFQIRYEEKALEQLFGEDFTLYKQQVRRWI